jgi:hypothetical protein
MQEEAGRQREGPLHPRSGELEPMKNPTIPDSRTALAPGANVSHLLSETTGICGVSRLLRFVGVNSFPGPCLKTHCNCRKV